MVKTKLTLTVDKDIIVQAKSKLALESKSISEVVEGMLSSYANSWIDKIMIELSVKEKYVSNESIVKNRKVGSDSGKIVRSMRNARANSVSR